MSDQAPKVQREAGVLSVAGAIDARNVMPVRTEGERLIAAADKDLEVDLSGLVTTHSVILSMLLCWSRQAEKQGVSLTFTGAPERLVSLAALSSLADWLQSRP
ncbi:STAS domain-containing protein [Marinobacter piscensis]|uniref:STAS domain-containing protein n=1 Tax=Marinobacter piscensis TaxID=1562308 RepID=UPI0011A3E4B9|nr:STAS domain-containing protein [Marinobacter piscensis]